MGVGATGFPRTTGFPRVIGFPRITGFLYTLVFRIYNTIHHPTATIARFRSLYPILPRGSSPPRKVDGPSSPSPLPPTRAFNPHTAFIFTRVFSTLQHSFPPLLYCSWPLFRKRGRQGLRVRRGSTAAPESPSVFGPPSRASDGGNVGFGLRSFKGNRSCVHFLCSWPAA